MYKEIGFSCGKTKCVSCLCRNDVMCYSPSLSKIRILGCIREIVHILIIKTYKNLGESLSEVRGSQISKGD